MLTRVSILAVSLLLASCSARAVSDQLPIQTSLDLTPANSHSSADPSTLPAASLTSRAQLPEVQCQGELPTAVKATLGDYRLAQKPDFVAAIRSYEQENPQQKLTCSIFTADFNGDGMNDYALLLVNPNTDNFRFQLMIHQGNGQFNSAVTKEFPRLPNSAEGKIYTSMTLKQAGELGSAARDYSPIKSGTWQEKVFQTKPAIELWKARSVNAAGIPQHSEVATLAYCSDVFYFFNAQLKTFGVCD